jgi:hypothetical protein
MLTFSKILVTPFSELLGAPSGRSAHKGGPIWPDWEQQVDARHCRGNKPVDQRPNEWPNEWPSETLLSRDLAWLGPIAPHFGHQIADFSMRIAPTLSEWKGANFICTTDPNAIRRLENVPKYFWQILDWFGLNQDRIVFSETNSLVSRLHVAPQAEQIGGVPPSEQHLNLMDELVQKNVGRVSRSGAVFVSRAGQMARFAGEAYLERALEEVGVKVIRPEMLDLWQQLECYMGADVLIFSEGSALHSVQLLGRSLGKVSILSRREGRFLEKRIQPRAESLDYGHLISHSVCGLMRSGLPAVDNAIGILDEEKVLLFFGRFGFDLKRVWSKGDFAERRDRDVSDWLAKAMTQAPWRSEASQTEIARRLREAKLDHLLGKLLSAGICCE